MNRKGICLKVLDLLTSMIDCPSRQEWVLDMINNILIEVLASIAQQEWETIHQRQAEGIATAKAQSKHLGCPKAKTPNSWDEVISVWRAGEITAVEVPDFLGHENIATTLGIYTHLFNEQRRDTSNIMDGIISNLFTCLGNGSGNDNMDPLDDKE